MYDEVDVSPDDAGFTHEILLSNGMSLGLRFRGFRLLSIRDLIPTKPLSLARPA